MKAVHGNDQVLPPVKRVKLLDVPPGMEYHKGPAALGLQGKPKTPAQLLEECKPGTVKQTQQEAKTTETQNKSDIVDANPQITAQLDSSLVAPHIQQSEQSNIVAQAAAAVGLSDSVNESKDLLDISTGRLIYQAQTSNSQGTPVAIEMKLNANEAAQIQAEFQRQQLMASQQHTGQIPLKVDTTSSHDIKIPSQITADLKLGSAPQSIFTVPLTYQTGQRMVSTSQATHPLLQRLVPGNQILAPNPVNITSASMMTPLPPPPHVLQQPTQEVQQQTVNNSIRNQNLPGNVSPSQNSLQQDILQLPQLSASLQQNQLRPQMIHSQEPIQVTLQQQQKQQQSQQPIILQQPANLERLYTTLPEYAQELFTASNTVSNLAQMRELIHGTSHANQGSTSQQ